MAQHTAFPGHAKVLAFDPRDINEAPEGMANGKPRPSPTEQTDNPALVFSAVPQDQTAKELPGTSAEPHGAFAAALLETLETLPADTPAALVDERVRAVLEGSSVPNQQPDLDAGTARRQQPLFGGTTAALGKIRTAALGAGDEGHVTLDVGQVSGVGVGSEFTAMQPNRNGQTIRLRIASLQGLARSSAEVVSPAGASVAPGELFELSKWVPADSPPIKVWMWPTNLSQQEILAAVKQVKASIAALVSDPAEQQWTHMLRT